MFLCLHSVCLPNNKKLDATQHCLHVLVCIVQAIARLAALHRQREAAGLTLCFRAIAGKSIAFKKNYFVHVTAFVLRISIDAYYPVRVQHTLQPTNHLTNQLTASTTGHQPKPQPTRACARAIICPIASNPSVGKFWGLYTTYSDSRK